MNRIEKTFAQLASKGKKALITFLTAGDPDHDLSLEIIKALPGAGADVIELGMPFTDPAADGPAIQLANQRALKAGADMKQTLSLVRDFRAGNNETPIVLMGYANPLLAYGFAAFMADAAEAGVDGLIIVDLPPEEDAELRTLAQKHGIDVIRLLTPTSDEKRLPTLLEGVSGFLYYVSITGITGTASADLGRLKPHIEAIKSRTTLPLAIGFGIKTPQDAKAFGAIGDAVVVGSALVREIEDNPGKAKEKILAKVRALKAALET